MRQAVAAVIVFICFPNPVFGAEAANPEQGPTGLGYRASPQQPDQVALFKCRPAEATAQANVRYVYAAYHQRSVDILRTAREGNTSRLSEMVAPAAEFSVGAGPRTKGAVAAIAFAKQLRPQRYQFTTASAGPFAMPPCGPVQTSLLFTSATADDAIVVDFEYREGRLVRSTGSEHAIVQGDF